MSSEETRTWTGPSAPERLNLLRQAKSIAIVGASDKPSRASYFVATYLQSSTRYKVYFVNPVVKQDPAVKPDVRPSRGPAGEPGHRGQVFCKHDHLPGVLDQAIAAGAKTLWLQLGSWHEDVAKEAEAAGLDVVMDRCVKIEHARFHVGLAPCRLRHRGHFLPSGRSWPSRRHVSAALSAERTGGPSRARLKVPQWSVRRASGTGNRAYRRRRRATLSR